MATTTMASLGYYDILEREGFHPPVTLRVNGADVFPGMPVTSQGETHPDVCLPDGVGDSVCGVTGLLENQDIGTVYADNSEVPVYLTGHGAIVKMYHALNGGSVVFGDIMVAQTLEALGFVEPLAKAIDRICVADYTSTVLATTIKHVFSLVGRAMETHASTGTTTPIKVCLSI